MVRDKGPALLIALVIGVAVGLLGSQVGAQADPEGEPIVREELAKRALETADGQQARVIRVTLQPGASFTEPGEPLVTYPAEEFVYVVEGSGVLTRENEEIQLEAGDLFYHSRSEPHSVANTSSSEPLVAVAVWIGDEGDF